MIHGNYLDDEEIAFLGQTASGWRRLLSANPRLVRSRAYPLEKMLAAGVTVALGTDGRGSSPDLSLLAEMRFAARRHPAVGLDEILKMGTIDGARALGPRGGGRLARPGKQADLAVVALPDRDAADPHELLFNSQEPVGGVLLPGHEMYVPSRRRIQYLIMSPRYFARRLLVSHRSDGLGQVGGGRGIGPADRGRDRLDGLDGPLSRHGHRHGEANGRRAPRDTASPDRRARSARGVQPGPIHRGRRARGR